MPPSSKIVKRQLLPAEPDNSNDKWRNPNKLKPVLQSKNTMIKEESSSESETEFDEIFKNLKKKGIGVDGNIKKEKNSHSLKRRISQEIENVCSPKKYKYSSEELKIKSPLKCVVRLCRITAVKGNPLPTDTFMVKSESSSTKRKQELKTIDETEDDCQNVETPKKRRPRTKRAASEESQCQNSTPVKQPRISLRNQNSTPIKNSRLSLPIKCLTPKTPKTCDRLNSKDVLQSPRTPQTKFSVNVSTPLTPVEKARISLHVSAVPDNLPCRGNEFKTIYKFLENKLVEGTGGCMYISGVPGTGKTATVTQVVRRLTTLSREDDSIPQFTYVELNGMRLSDPRQVYTVLYRTISGKKERISPELAQEKLLRWFNKKDLNKRSTVVLLDELDLMCTRKQDVVFNLLDWPSHPNSRLIVLTIANTMDMPERKLKGRVSSRLGLTRVTFLPYTFEQLKMIVHERLRDCAGEEAFVNDAIQLAARKVASVSGDARRALDICRRATELVADPTQPVTIAHIDRAIREMTNTNIVQHIKGCSDVERLFLRSVKDCAVRSGLDEVEFKAVQEHLMPLCALEGLPRPNTSTILLACRKLSATRLIFTHNQYAGLYQRITLNVSHDDIHYALTAS